MAKNTKEIKVDLETLEFTFRLEPIAKYPDGTWGAKATLVINGLPWCAQDAFPPTNKIYFLHIKGTDAVLISSVPKVKRLR